MKFLVLTQYFPPEVGAAQTRLAAMVREWKAQGHEVEILTALPNYPMGKIFPGFEGKFYDKAQWEGCTVHRFWLVAGTGKSILRLLNYLSFAFTACFGLFVCKKPDWIFVNSGPLFLSVPGFLLSRVWGIDFIFNVSDLWPRSVEHLAGSFAGKIFIKMALVLEGWSYRKAAFVNAITEGVKEVLLNEKQVPAEKLLYFPNGVDTVLFKKSPVDEALKASLGLSGKKIVMYPGNHGYAHALHRVLEAAEMLQNANDLSIQFFLVGGGSEKAKLVAQAQEKGLRNVTFHDPVSPELLVPLINISDIGLVHVRNSPLASETRPAKMFPLMAMAKPIVFAGFGEGAEMLEKLQAGVVTKVEDPVDLIRGIKKLISEPELAQKMGQNGEAFVNAKMSFAAITRDWLSEFNLRAARKE
jgi:glycosyltransferase involved in cell wall biosynthesis